MPAGRLQGMGEHVVDPHIRLAAVQPLAGVGDRVLDGVSRQGRLGARRGDAGQVRRQRGAVVQQLLRRRVPARLQEGDAEAQLHLRVLRPAPQRQAQDVDRLVVLLRLHEQHAEQQQGGTVLRRPHHRGRGVVQRVQGAAAGEVGARAQLQLGGVLRALGEGGDGRRIGDGGRRGRGDRVRHGVRLPVTATGRRRNCRSSR